MIREILKTDIDTVMHWFNNPVTLFLSSPNSLYPCTSELISEELIKKNNTFVLCEKDELIGCISVDSDKIISHLFIIPKFRNKKYSKKLISYVINEEKKLFVLIHKNQREHKKLFETMNFSDSSEVFEFKFEDSIELFTKFTFNE